jgi:hypothetical protein
MLSVSKSVQMCTGFGGYLSFCSILRWNEISMFIKSCTSSVLKVYLFCPSLSKPLDWVRFPPPPPISKSQKKDKSGTKSDKSRIKTKYYNKDNPKSCPQQEHSQDVLSHPERAKCLHIKWNNDSPAPPGLQALIEALPEGIRKAIMSLVKASMK